MKSWVVLLSVNMAVITVSSSVSLIFMPSVLSGDGSAVSATVGGATPGGCGVGVGVDAQAATKTAARMSTPIDWRIRPFSPYDTMPFQRRIITDGTARQ